jgi:hypothetical protein
MRKPSLFLMAVAVLVLVSAGGTASATTIDFSNLVGANEDPYAGSSQNGFDVAPALGSWFEGHLFGNPEPSIFAGPIGSPTTSAILVSKAGGKFTFDSVDLACNNGDTCPFEIFGFLNGSPIGSFAGTVPAILGFGFVTEFNPAPATLIDALVIAIAPGTDTTSMNIDNIVVEPVAAPVPEPTSMALMGSALVGLALKRRRRG